MATYTSTTFANNQPKHAHIGVISVSGQVNLGASASSNGDVIFLAKIPHGANYVSIEADHTTGATSQALSYGLASGGPAGSATFSCFIASGAQGSTILRKNVVGVPAQVSCSDNDPNRYGILAAKVESGTATTSLIINFIFNYRMD
jgi:hypothetical protein